MEHLARTFDKKTTFYIPRKKLTIKIDYLAREDLLGAATLHKENLSYSLNSGLGKQHLFNLYRLMLLDNNSKCAGIWLNGKLVAVGSISVDVRKSKTFIIKNMTLAEIFTISLRLIFSYLLFKKLIFEFMLSRKTPDFLGAAELTSIVVHKDHQDKGLGGQLLGFLELSAANMGANYIIADARSPQAIKFYLKNEWMILTVFKDACILKKHIKVS